MKKYKTATYALIKSLGLRLFDEICEVGRSRKDVFEMLHKLTYEYLRRHKPDLSIHEIDPDVVKIFKENIEHVKDFPELEQNFIRFCLNLIEDKPIEDFREIFLRLFERVENKIRNKLAETIKEKYGSNLTKFQEELKLPKRDVYRFTVSELVDACKRWKKKFGEDLVSENILDEFKETINIRNHFVHGRINKIDSNRLRKNILSLIELNIKLFGGDEHG